MPRHLFDELLTAFQKLSTAQNPTPLKSTIITANKAVDVVGSKTGSTSFISTNTLSISVFKRETKLEWTAKRRVCIYVLLRCPASLLNLEQREQLKTFIYFSERRLVLAGEGYKSQVGQSIIAIRQDASLG